MLLIEEFSFGNFKSFKDVQTLRMSAANIKSADKSLDDNNIIHIGEKNALLKSKVIYGANASGKSNVIQALFTFCNIISYCLSEDNRGIHIIDKFLFSDEARDKPSFFQLIFYIDDIKYRYGFEASDENILSEWLYIIRQRETSVFTREGQKINVTKANMEIGYDVANMKSKLFSEKVLFLSVAESFSDKLASLIIGNIKEFLSLNSKNNIDKRKNEFIDDVLFKEKIIKLLKCADVGLEGLDSFEFGDEKMGKDKFLLGIHSRYNANLEKVGNYVTIFDAMESEGTKEMLNISLPIITALERGYPIIIDEFGAKLHPLLTQKILSLFNSLDNKKSQIIVVTHTTELMSPRLLRRDQIDFVEKDKYGRSYLYTLVELKGTRNGKYEKDYLDGKYGAIPFLGNWDRLCQIVDNATEEND